MIISSLRVVGSNDLSQFAWASLRQFHDVAYVTEFLSTLHHVDRRARPNVAKQAMQIRYCLIQAKEYFDAAKSVSLATKPTLLYYCAMSLAIAEILVKQDGNSSLDRAREQHRHHGLTFSVAGVNKKPTLNEACSALRAIPHIAQDGLRKGTFELWHRTARGFPLVSQTRTFLRGGQGNSFQLLFDVDDDRYMPIPIKGITLWECFRNSPGMYEAISQQEYEPKIIRGALKRNIRPESEIDEISIILHPGYKTEIDKYLNLAMWSPSDWQRVDFVDLGNGGIIKINLSKLSTGDEFKVDTLHASNWTTSELRIWTETQELNEFGFLYVGLYIMGNYARYFPDKWMLDIEQSSPLARMVQDFLWLVEDRLALLTLSELSRKYHVVKE